MKVFFNILGVLFLIAGIGGAIYIIVAVATDVEGFTAIREVIPPLVFHAVAMFLGMVFFGLGQRVKKAIAGRRVGQLNKHKLGGGISPLSFFPTVK